MRNKKNILYIGNCQTAAIKHILNLDHNFYNETYIAVHDRIENNTIDQLILDSDIIITQQIFENYGNASTKHLVLTKKPSTTLIIFPSCYMKLYYFDTSYYYHNNQQLTEPSHYHYHSIVNSFLNKKTKKYCIENFIDNKNLKTYDELNNILQEDIEQLYIRYNKIKQILYDNPKTYQIDICNFISHNAKHKLLFYSFNHPTQILLKYIVDKILDILNINTQISNNMDVLSQPKSILYSCLTNILEFNIDNHKPAISDNTTLEEIINLYFESYTHTGLSNESSKAGSYRIPFAI